MSRNPGMVCADNLHAFSLSAMKCGCITTEDNLVQLMASHGKETPMHRTVVMLTIALVVSIAVGMFGYQIPNAHGVDVHGMRSRVA